MSDNKAGNGLRIAVVSPGLRPVESNGISFTPSGAKADDDAALRESIRSVYRLWKMSRRSNGEENDGEVFLRVARQVIEMP
jgi:hypothetical protein